MDDISRRKAITLSVAAPTIGLALPQGGEIDTCMIGVNIKIAWMNPRYSRYQNWDDPKLPQQWCVWLPDFKTTKDRNWYPGMAIPGWWVPLTEYLTTLEDEYINRKADV